MPDFKIFSSTVHPKLAEEVAKEMGVDLSAITISRFSCGEIYVNVNESIRGKDAYILHTSTDHVNDDYMELFLIIDAMKRAMASSVHVIMPHFGYARQDRRTRTREAISSKVIANLLERVGADHLVTFNLHSDQIQGFFDITVDNISTRSFFADYFKNKNDLDLNNTVVVSTDAGGAKAVHKFSSKLGTSFAIMHKHRSEHNHSEVVGLIGDVKNKAVIIYDDMIDTAGSVCNAKEELVRQGALSDQVYLAATHPIFSGSAIDRLAVAGFKEVVVANTIPVSKEKEFKGLNVLSIAPLISRIIMHIQTKQSVSVLFTDINKK
jgi:ribose-phosphate pyrophosphokinase